MSAILGVFRKRGTLPGSGALDSMLRPMQPRGVRTGWRAADDAVLGVARHDWELSASFSGNVLVYEEGDLVVASDASLYYRADLARRLRAAGCPPAGEAPAQLIAAAYRAWGMACPQQLEGDFAFLVWDGTRRELLAARDFMGRRPLVYADLPDTFIIASTVGALLTHPSCPADLNVGAIAAVAANLDPLPEETSFRRISALPAGSRLSWSSRVGVRTERYWTPPTFRERGGDDFDSAAEELHALLSAAVAERLAVGPVTAMTLSGGWDSSAVFGIGQELLRSRGAPKSLLPVSISYPPGDSGREDERITAIAQHWSVPVHWIDSQQHPVIRAHALIRRPREEPWFHAFEFGVRSMARGARSVGARVALDGYGGDFLFHTTDEFLADLFRAGRWLELRREWQAAGAGGTGFRNFARWAIKPALPRWLLFIVGCMRGEPVPARLERKLPVWMAATAARRLGLDARAGSFARRARGEPWASFQNRWYFTNPSFARTQAGVHALTLAEGVEFRSPLMDQRVIRFAADRPRTDRAAGRERKRLLRAAVKGLVPHEVLGSRPYWTGTTRTSFQRALQNELPAVLREISGAPLQLEVLGVVDGPAFRREADAFLREPERRRPGAALLRAVATEQWLRALAGQRQHELHTRLRCRAPLEPV